jgi:hypothetical protein
MSYTKPYLTSDSIVESVELRMMFPLSQETFTYNDVLKIVNEEMMINAVPQVKTAHEEYFVFKVMVPLVNGIARYEIPYRALGMALSDLAYSDESGNYVKMNRVAPEDKAFFQSNYSDNVGASTYYLEGNTVVLSSQIVSNPTGNLNFFIYLRPNYLVRNDRAAIIQSYQKTIEFASLPSAGDSLTITSNVQTQNPTVSVFTAVSGSPASNYEFQIGGTAAITAQNLTTAITNAGISGISATYSAGNSDVTYNQISTTFESTNTDAIFIDNDTTCVKFDQLPATYTDPDTNQTSDLYVEEGKVDFLQTDAGHTTYNFDVELLEIIPGNIGRFATNKLQAYLNNSSGGNLEFLPIKIGDYICPQNECIIPQIPSELHYALAERAASFILQAIGDSEGYARSEKRIEKMNEAQSALIDSRISGSVPKVFNPNNLLRSAKGRRRRW